MVIPRGYAHAWLASSTLHYIRVRYVIKRYTLRYKTLWYAVTNYFLELTGQSCSLELTNVNYYRNIKFSIPLNQWLAALNEKKKQKKKTKTFSVGKLRSLLPKLTLPETDHHNRKLSVTWFCCACVQTAMFKLHIYMIIDVCKNFVAFYLCIHLTSWFSLISITIVWFPYGEVRKTITTWPANLQNFSQAVSLRHQCAP